MTEAEPLAEWERELLRPRDPNVSEATAPLWVYAVSYTHLTLPTNREV